jgi:hypothetical protein
MSTNATYYSPMHRHPGDIVVEMSVSGAVSGGRHKMMVAVDEDAGTDEELVAAYERVVRELAERFETVLGIAAARRRIEIKNAAALHELTPQAAEELLRGKELL